MGVRLSRLHDLMSCQNLGEAGRKYFISDWQKAGVDEKNVNEALTLYEQVKKYNISQEIIGLLWDYFPDEHHEEHIITVLKNPQNEENILKLINLAKELDNQEKKDGSIGRFVGKSLLTCAHVVGLFLKCISSVVIVPLVGLSSLVIWDREPITKHKEWVKESIEKIKDSSEAASDEYRKINCDKREKAVNCYLGFFDNAQKERIRKEEGKDSEILIKYNGAPKPA